MHDKVAFVTGAARGQGRSHAVRLAEVGADLVLLDICRQVAPAEYPMSTSADLEETVWLVEQLGARAVSVEGDVRNLDDVVNAVQTGVSAFGRLDFVVANAGLLASTGSGSLEPAAWDISVDTMLKGVYHTLRASMSPMIEAGRGGSIVITGSTSAYIPTAYKVEMLNWGAMGYSAAKHGCLGLMRNFAYALGPYGIRVNAVHPAGVRTHMATSEVFTRAMSDAPGGWMANPMGVDLVEPHDVSEAVLWLLSEASRFVTGVSLPIDAGTLAI